MERAGTWQEKGAGPGARPGRTVEEGEERARAEEERGRGPRERSRRREQERPGRPGRRGVPEGSARRARGELGWPGEQGARGLGGKTRSRRRGEERRWSARGPGKRGDADPRTGAPGSGPSRICLDPSRTTRAAPAAPLPNPGRGGPRQLMGVGLGQAHAARAAGASGWIGRWGPPDLGVTARRRRECRHAARVWGEGFAGLLRGAPQGGRTCARLVWKARVEGAAMARGDRSVGSECSGCRLPGGGSARGSDGRGGREGAEDKSRGFSRVTCRGDPCADKQAWEGKEPK